MIRTLSIIVAGLSLSACVSVLPEQKAPDGLYRFGPMPERHQVDTTVAIREPEAPRLFGGRMIAAESGDGALRIVRGVEWADNATRLMQVALLDVLGDEGSGVAVAFESGVLADYELVWRVEDFTLTGGEAHCSLEATLLEARSRRVVAQGNFETTASTISATNGRRAQALATAGRSCVAKVGSFVSEHAVDMEEVSGN